MIGAKVGDWILEPRRSHNQRGLIVGVYAADGAPPYLVRWEGDGRQTLLTPGPETELVSVDQPDGKLAADETRPGGSERSIAAPAEPGSIAGSPD